MGGPDERPLRTKGRPGGGPSRTMGGHVVASRRSDSSVNFCIFVSVRNMVTLVYCLSEVYCMIFTRLSAKQSLSLYLGIRDNKVYLNHLIIAGEMFHL